MNQLSLFQRVDIEEDVPLDKSIYYIKEDSGAIDHLINNLVAALEFAFDIETYGDKDLDGLRWWQGKIRLLQFGFRDGSTFILDWMLLSDEDKAVILPLIKQALESKQIVKLMQNGKFDCCFCIAQLGIHPRNIRDTILLSKLLYAGVQQYRHSLEALAKRELEINIDKTEQKNAWGENRLLNKQLNYAAKDVQILFPLYDKLRADINERYLNTQAKIECDVLPAIAEMECNGFPIDVERTKECLNQHLELAKKQIDLFKSIFPMLTITASSMALVPLLNDKFNIKLISTDDGELSKHKDIPVIAAIANYRSIKKQIDYLKGILINERDGRVYSNFRQLNPAGFGRTGSGKLNKNSTASDGLNLQNVPNPYNYELISIRSCFRAHPGRSLLVNDLSSAHGRIGTEISQDPVLLNLYNNNMDLHLVTAVGLAKQKGYDWDYDHMLKAKNEPKHPDHNEVIALRKLAKPVQFGSQNLQGGKGLQIRIRQDGIEVSLDEAYSSSKGWRNTYHGLFAKQLSLIDQANYFRHQLPGIDNTFGLAIALSGRQLWMMQFPDKYKDNRYSVKGSDCVAFQWTATCQDIMKLAMARVQDDFDDHPEWEAKLTNICHDELDADCNSTYELPVAECLFKHMNESMQRWINSIPVNDPNAKAQDCISESWGDK